MTALRRHLRALMDDYRNVSRAIDQTRAMTARERQHVIARSEPGVHTLPSRSWAMGEMTDPRQDDIAHVAEWGPCGFGEAA